MRDPISGQPDDAAHHIDRVNRALVWLSRKLPAATTRVVNAEPELLGVEWRGWSIEIDPSGCTTPGDKTLSTTIRRGESRHEKLYSNWNHMLNSVKKIARENP